MRFSKNSLKRFDKVHPKLIVWATAFLKAHPEYDISILDGARTLEQQAENVRKGVSWTMNSDHLVRDDGYAYALDVKPSTYDWDESVPKWQEFAVDGELVARELGLNIQNLGLDIGKDFVHFSLKD